MHGPLRVKTAKNFSINSREIRSWVKDEKSILQNSRSNAKRYTKEKFLLMEKKLEEELLELGKNETILKRWCFTHRRRKILNDLYPETEFKFPDHWFDQFSNWKGVSLSKKTHKRHKDPAVFRLSVQQYQAKLLPNRNGKTPNYVTWLVLTKLFCLLLLVITKPLIALVQKRLGVLQGALVYMRDSALPN